MRPWLRDHQELPFCVADSGIRKDMIQHGSQKALFADLAALGCIEELHFTLLPGKLTQPFGPHGLQCFRMPITSLQSDMYVLSGVSPVCVVLDLRRYPSSLELISPTALDGPDSPRYYTPCQAQGESRNDILALPKRHQ